MLAVLTACEPGAPADPTPRLVLLYAPCTVSTAFLSPYREGITFTPHLDAFARKAMRFDAHYTEAGQSGIAYASLFTGGQADHHGVFRHPAKLRSEKLVIAEAFAQAGYETFYWNDHGMASPTLEYAQGVPPENVHRRPRPGKTAADDGLLRASDPAFVAILEKLEANPSYRAFILANPVVTHSPYEPSRLAAFTRLHPELREDLTDEEMERYARIYKRNVFPISWNHAATIERLGLNRAQADKLRRVIELLYAANVSHLDRLFGQVIDEIDRHGLLGASLIVFTADHGEVMYRGTTPFPFTHSMQLAPEVLRVPFMIFGPGVGVPVGTWDAVTRSIDVFPTLVGLANLPGDPAGEVPGVDLSMAIRGRGSPPNLPAYAHTTVLVPSIHAQMRNPRTSRNWKLAARFFPDEKPERMWVSVVEDDLIYKWISLDGEHFFMEVFDLADDPGETTNLFDPRNRGHREVKERLLAYKELLVNRYEELRDTEAGRLLPRRREEKALRALGYVE